MFVVAEACKLNTSCVRVTDSSLVLGNARSEQDAWTTAGSPSEQSEPAGEQVSVFENTGCCLNLVNSNL